jgi:hypothetical protein
MNKPALVCLTPVRNEAWILHRFLACASLWADHIIVLDQLSDDDTREIARRFPKVTLIENRSERYSEDARQKILLEAARKIPGAKILFALDADEFLTANFLTSCEWETVLRSPPGTVIRMQRANLTPDFQSYWIEVAEDYDFAFGFVDDGSEHVGRSIHSERVPTPKHATSLKLRDIKLMHYQFVDWERMQSKHRWYQCWERLNQSWQRPVTVYRTYHHMYAIAERRKLPLPGDVFAEPVARGVDMTSVRRDAVFWWDREVVAFLAEHGAKKFKREAIWDVDWIAVSEKVGAPLDAERAGDPRTRFDKYVHRWLRKTQPVAHYRSVRLADRMLRLFGW